MWQKLVKERGYSDSVSGGINLLGNMFNYSGPMLWTLYLIHDPATKPEAVIADVDAAIARLQQEPVSQAELDRVLTKMRADLYDVVGESTRFGLVDMLATFSLFDDDPGRINRLEAQFRAVTPGLIQKVAQEYLRASNRTVLVVEAGRPAPAGDGK